MNDYVIFTILMLAAYIFSVYAQVKVTSTFQKYSSVQTKNGLTGVMCASRILSNSDAADTGINMISGELTDNYDPKSNTVNLSSSTYSSDSISAIGVSAHECGHAIQYAKSYSPIKIRNAIIPATKISSTLSWPLILLGIVFSIGFLAYAGVILFSVTTLFQLITLPVELDASKRALKILEEEKMLDEDELPMAKKVLSAAALTYVGALAVSLTNLLRIFSMVKRK